MRTTVGNAPASFIVLLALYCCSAFATDNALTFSAFRDVANPYAADAISKLGKRQSSQISTKIGKLLYWFGNFSVGESTNLNLVIDTGSTDLLLNPGVYKPSVNAKPYSTPKFEAHYEGVDRAGFGLEFVNGTAHVDNVTRDGLTVTNQVLGSIKSFKYDDVPPHANVGKGIWQGDGIIGFAGPGASAFTPKADSWFFNLCKTKAISSCQFGLAFGTSGKGLLNVGKVATNLIQGDLVTVPHIPLFGETHSYGVRGDVTVDNKIVAENQTFDMDVGSNDIQGPIDAVKEIFEVLGYSPFSITKKTMTVLESFFPCNKPPTLGFSFPTKSELLPGEEATIFNVLPSVWNVYNHGNNNCTTILGGTNSLTDKKTNTSFWLLGQSFFEGHYVNFDIDSNTIGYGNLKDPTMANAA